MSRIFWDAMLFIYLLEDNPGFAPSVRAALARSRRRGDILLTSYLSLAEALVGMPDKGSAGTTLQDTILEMGFTLVSFDERAVQPFRVLRRDFRLRQPDSMHLACAAASKTDLFLTEDKQLLKRHLHIPGIQFISNLENAPL